MMNIAYRKYSKKRYFSNYVLGSTIFVSKSPQLKNQIAGSYSISPLTFVMCHPEEIGLCKKWSRHLLFNLDAYCLLHVYHLISVYKGKGNHKKLVDMKLLLIQLTIQKSLYLNHWN